MIEALWGILIAVYQTDQPSGSERTPMDAKVYELINDQINKELYSAYLYLAFADYYEEEGLSGYANYFEIQA